MAYIPPFEFSVPPDTEETSSVCGKCGYDLQGLAWNTVCPECGALPSSAERKGTCYKDLPLSQMSEKLIRTFSIRCITVALLLPLIAARLLFSFSSLQMGYIGILRDGLIAGLWAIAVTWLTRPIDDPEAIRHGLGADGKLRTLSMLGSFGGIGMAFVVNTPSLPFARVVFVCFLVVSFAGMFCLLLFLIEIAIWVRDLKAKKFLETAAWGPLVLLALAIVVYLLPFPPIFALVIVILATFLSLSSIFGVMFLASSVLQSVTHAREYREYQERRLKRKNTTGYPSPE